MTALCRAVDDAGALALMQALLDKITLTHGGLPSADTAGIIEAFDRNILDFETFQMLLNQETSIGRVCCFWSYQLRTNFEKGYQVLLADYASLNHRND